MGLRARRCAYTSERAVGLVYGRGASVDASWGILGALTWCGRER